MPAAKLLKKITPATVVGETGSALNPDAPKPIPTERVIFDLYGLAVKTRTGSTNLGPWVQFVGEFEAVTPDGEVFASARCHIPQPFEDMLYAQLAQVQAPGPNGEDNSKASVRFAVRLSIVPPAKGKPSASGYEYRIQPLLEPETDSPIANLRAEVKRLALPNPSPAAESNKKHKAA